LRIYWKYTNSINQRFLTWGTRTHGGRRAVHRGYASSFHGVSKQLKVSPFWSNTIICLLYFWGTLGVYICIWGSSNGCYFDMGVRKGGAIKIRLNPNTKRLRITGLNNNTLTFEFLTLIYSIEYYS
jgi:hypothetical protein